MIAAAAWIVGIGVGWLTLGTLVAVVLGKAIRTADCCPHPPDDDWLADQPVEVLSQAERDRRAIERWWVA